MSKPKFVLTANPTFKATVSIPIPGDLAAPIEFIFKHKTRDQYKEMLNAWGAQSDSETILEIASGWDLEDPFDKDHIEKMLQNYHGSGNATIKKYIDELTGARLGN